MSARHLWFFCATALAICACARAPLPSRFGAETPDPRLAALQTLADKTLPWQEKMPPARPGEWRSYWREQSESPARYLANHPQTITAKRRALYLQPLGDSTPAQRRNHEIIREFLEIYFGSPATLLPALRTSDLRNSMLRANHGQPTINVVDLTDKFLVPRLPPDGWGLMAFCADDLYKDGVSGIYGDTLLYGRAGAISWFHLGGDFSLMLKGAAHESAHMLSLRHCSAYLCNLNGRITLDEFHRSPLYLCPDCMTKLAWATGVNMRDRYARLAEFCARYNLPREANFYRRAADALAAPATTAAVAGKQ
jgi:archaemetzincin